MNETKYFQTASKFLLNIVQDGDGLELLRDLKDEVAQLVIFDPQYKTHDATSVREYINYTGKKLSPTYHPIPLVNQNKNKIELFLAKIERLLKPNGYLILWINREMLLKENPFHNLPIGLKVKEILIWVKGKQLAFGSLTCPFRQMNEYCLLIQKEPYKDNSKDRSIGNVFNEIVNYVNRHIPHQKPYQMTQTIIQQLTQEGDLVVDPCAGSFVSLRACQSLKRNFLGTDLTLRKLMNFNINKERSRTLLKQEANNYKP